MAANAKPDAIASLREQIAASMQAPLPQPPVVIHVASGATLHLVLIQPRQ